MRLNGLRGSDAVAIAARRLVATVGEREATARLDVAPATLARLVAGMTVQSGTLIAAALRLHVNLAGTPADADDDDIEERS